jgi:hypothetical protein
MKSATGSQPKKCKVPTNQQRITFPVVQRRMDARNIPAAAPRKRRLTQHTIHSALAYLPPATHSTANAERRSYVTIHLNENDAIMLHSGENAEVPGDHADNSFRVYFQNINGLKMMHDDESVISAVGFLASFRASVPCFAETNVNWRKENVYSRVHQQFRRCLQSVKLETSSSGLKLQTINQPGGTCTAVLGKWCARKKAQGIVLREVTRGFACVEDAVDL